ncbi:MAG: SRPBCC family protein [Haloferacaceae archaeon]
MPTYTRRTRVAAPLDEVRAFHSRIEGLEALTPAWLHLRVESVRGPEGEADPEVLAVGSKIRLSVRPFGVGPRQRVTSRIVARESDEGSASFRDVMVDGPFRRWEHTHSFFADGNDTVVVDRVAYELPLGPVGRALAPLARVGLDPMFRYRHRRTRELLEGTAADGGWTVDPVGGEPS